jgi:glycosyltransferase involved in cell wall biosynthesis
MRTAIVYDRVNKWGGAERVLLALHEIFPDAPLYTAVYSKQKAQWANVFPRVVPSFLQKIPILNQHHELMGAFTPIAFESFDFSVYDLVISVTSEAAKGIITNPGTVHICYCLTPTRYLWSGYEEYKVKPPSKLGWIPFYNYLSKPFIGYSRVWDKVASQRPDYYIAISSAVKERIKKYYERKSEIIYPPVDINKFEIRNSKFEKYNKKQISNLERIYKLKPKTYYLIVSRLVPYKKVDLALEAFSRINEKLVVVGTGSEEGKYKIKYPPSLKLRRAGKLEQQYVFTGFVKDEELAQIYSGAKALIFPQEEDFGITAVEAQAYGIPVIAYKKGGALDTVIENKTGIFFDKQTVDSLIDSIIRFNKFNFKKEDLLNNAKRFSKEVFKSKFEKFIESVL